MSKNTKQTAVEWLVSKMPTAFKELTVNKELIKQAKEMEKQQIINAYQAGDGDAYHLDETKSFGEQYYNEKYGK